MVLAPNSPCHSHRIFQAMVRSFSLELWARLLLISIEWDWSIDLLDCNLQQGFLFWCQSLCHWLLIAVTLILLSTVGAFSLLLLSSFNLLPLFLNRSCFAFFKLWPPLGILENKNISLWGLEEPSFPLVAMDCFSVAFCCWNYYLRNNPSGKCADMHGGKGATHVKLAQCCE